MAAVPSIGRATRVEGRTPPEADLTRALYEDYANQIFRYCLHQLGSREEAEDAVQSTFLNAFRGLKRGVVPELEAAWLFKIAHNVCLSRRRSSWRRGRVESPADFEAVEELTPAPSRGADELIGLQDVLEQMPETQRRAILLREWQGLSYREIAAELELSQGAVETLIFRARRSLAAGLQEPPERMKRRLLRGVDLGSMVAGLKALLLGGGAAAKVAAAVAIVSATTVVAADPVVQHQQRSHGSQPARTVVPAQQLRTTRFQMGTSVVPAPPSTARVVPVRHAKRAKHQVASSGHRSTPVLPEVSAPASKRAAHAKSPAAAAPAAKGHAKPSGAVNTPPGAKAKVTRTVSSKAHAGRAPQSHAIPKKVKSAPPAAAPQPSAPPAAHSGAGAGKTKDPTG
ncbi:MAG: RNA polymerase sigma factor [Actinomycetota bacterium]|nr:RNA polymerase sigma factor [Actinomycetota bacterium]